VEPTILRDTSGAPTPVFGVILAGGLGTRFSRDHPKQLVTLAGRPVLAYAAHTFDTCGTIDHIVVAAHPDVLQDISEACADGVHHTPVTVVPGGASRNASVANAVAAIDTLARPGATPPDDARILVHDAVRPLASADLVRTVADRLRTARAVMPVLASSDRLVEVHDGAVTRFVDQAGIVRGQSPGGFHLGDLRAAFDHYRALGSPPLVTVFEVARAWDPHYEITTVPGEPANIKITYPVDLAIAAYLVTCR